MLRLRLIHVRKISPRRDMDGRYDSLTVPVMARYVGPSESMENNDHGADTIGRNIFCMDKLQQPVLCMWTLLLN